MRFAAPSRRTAAFRERETSLYWRVIMVLLALWLALEAVDAALDVLHDLQAPRVYVCTVPADGAQHACSPR